MKALIVEDEKMARDNLARTLTTLFPDIEIAGTAASVAETLRLLRDPAFAADVIFMDVELSDGDCFEVFRQENVRAKVIMTTAYDNYAVKAFEAGSIDYLLKPIEPARSGAARRSTRSASSSASARKSSRSPLQTSHISIPRTNTTTWLPLTARITSWILRWTL